MDQYDDQECTFVLHDAANYMCDHRNAVSQIKIRLKTRLHVISVSRFVVEHIIVSAHIYDAGSRVNKAVITDLTVHTYANFIELFVHGLIL